jgi:hypothetical protein
MNLKSTMRGACLALMGIFALCASATQAMAQNQMNVLGGSLTWSTSSSSQPCGTGVFQIMEYTSFQWQYGSTTYPVNGSTAFIYNSPAFQCPPDGPQGGVGYTIPSNLGFPANCAFVFTPTGPSGGGGAGNVATHQCNPAFPTPPSGATSFTNLQWAGLSQDPTPPPSGATWQKHNGTQTGSTCTNTGTDSVTPGYVFSGSSQYGALKMTDTNNGPSPCEWNVLGTLDLDYNPAPLFLTSPNVNVEVDLKFYMPSGTTYQAIEFDPDLTLLNQNHTYQASVECAFHDTGGSHWKYWDSSVHTWNSFTMIGASAPVPCSLSSGWHHLQLYATINTATYTYEYQGLMVDGTVLFQNSNTSVNACNGASDPICRNWATRLWVEQQLDNYSTTSSTTEVADYDYYSLTIW